MATLRHTEGAGKARRWFWKDQYGEEEAIIRKRKEPHTKLGYVWLVVSKEEGETLRILHRPPPGHPDFARMRVRKSATGTKKATLASRARARVREAKRRVKKAGEALRGNPKVNPKKLRRLTNI